MAEENKNTAAQENAEEVKGFKKFTQKHAELWKFIKFAFASGGSSVIELIVHMVLLNTVFASLTSIAITNSTLNMIGITSKGYLYTYLISTTVGYAIAFVLNRKITFKADSNPTVSMILYIIMVVITIFANGWIGSAITTFAQAHSLTGNFWDLLIKVVCMLIPTIWTYPCNRFIIHRKKKTPEELEEMEKKEN